MTPNDATNQVYLGDARFGLGDRAGARDAFVRAVTLRPGDAYAVERAVALLVEEGRAADAREVLARARHVHAASLVARLEVEVAMGAGDEAEALDALESLARAGGRAHLDPALTKLAASPWADAAFARVEALFVDERPVPVDVGLAWAEARDAHRPDGAGRVLASRDRLNAAGQAAVGAWIEALARRGRRWALLWIGLVHWGWLRATPDGWGAVGYALHVLGWQRACVRWLGGWREREGVAPWVLLNLAGALVLLGRGREAEAVSAFALTLGADHTAPAHRAHAAWQRAMGGDVEGAVAAVAPLAGGDVYVRGFRALVHALDAAARPEGAPELSSHLAEANVAGGEESVIEAAHRATVDRIAGRA